MAVSCTCRDGGFQKNFEIFSENRGQNSTCLATTPIEGHFVAGFGKKRLFSKKSRKNPDRFQKNSEYTVWKVFFRKRVNISPFFAYIRGGRESESKLFSKKVHFSLSVCRKNLNIPNEQTARKDQLPAKRKEEWMQQTVKRIIKNGRTGMS